MRLQVFIEYLIHVIFVDQLTVYLVKEKEQIFELDLNSMAQMRVIGYSFPMFVCDRLAQSTN